jgi:uncharacterized membrane protein YvbJ
MGLGFPSKMTTCSNCGQAVEAANRFCRQCGLPLSPASPKMFRPRMITPEDAASYWNNFFRPFFKMAFIFFGCFFALALIMVVFWYFTFHR